MVKNCIKLKKYINICIKHKYWLHFTNYTKEDDLFLFHWYLYKGFLMIKYLS